MVFPRVQLKQFEMTSGQVIAQYNQEEIFYVTQNIYCKLLIVA